MNIDKNRKRKMDMEIDETDEFKQILSEKLENHQPIIKSAKLDDCLINANDSIENLLQDIDFDDEDSDVLQNDEMEQKSTAPQLDLTTWKRCTVVSIEKDSKSWEWILTVRKEDEEGLCRLQGPWISVKILPNQIVSILAIWNDKLQCHCVTSDAGFIVTMPDHLISGTSVVGALFCRRKGVLADKFTGIDCSNKIMTIGSLVHELFQIVLKHKLQTLEEIQKCCNQILQQRDTVFQLYASDMTVAEMRKEMEKFMENISEFVARYITGDRARHEKDQFCDRIDSIADIEENIWVPQLGLKGKVDVSVRVRRRNNFFKSDVQSMPLEIKTGRASFSSEHRGQVAIYQMMMNEVGESVDAGLLLYLREGITKEIKISRHDQRDLILLRNDLAYYLTTNQQSDDVRENLEKFEAKLKSFDVPLLPEPINHHSACGTCPYSSICCAFQSRDKEQLSDRHPLRSIMNETLKLLTTEHIDYFVHWTGLLALEEAESRRGYQINNMWTKSGESRQQMGQAICDLMVKDVICVDESYMHVFVLQKRHVGATQDRFSSFDLTLSGMHIGDYLRVSTPKRIAIAAGRVVAITKDSITMRLERNLTQRYSNETFILDRNESNSLNGFNLATLGALIDNQDNSLRLRNIIIDRRLPTFSKKLPNIIASVGKQILIRLNVIQQKAVLKALTANDYLLLKGLPGTGKTQTLVAIVMLYSLMGKSVLITSHTNSAVDNVLMKLHEKGLEFMRLGSSTASISPSMQKFTESVLTQNCKTTQDFEQLYDKYDIIGVTCLSSAHPMLMKRRFDVCLVDEATQVLQTEVIRPLLYADKFVLVGDPEQLPPLVRSKEARLLGADESLFNRLDSNEATAVLTMQYRMNRVITKLANELTYNGMLKCATETISMETMKFPSKDIANQRCHTEKWLTKPLSNHLDLSVVFLDTGNVFQRSIDFANTQIDDLSEILERNFETNSNSNEIDKRKRIITNYCEAAVCFYICQALIQAGVKGSSIGIIAPYRAQVELLKQLFLKYETQINEMLPHAAGIEVNTVDQYQGRDKDVIIYSCTKCDNPLNSTSTMDQKTNTEILEDQRRLTVAITRSKHKLIMIGDVASLQMYTPFQGLFRNISGMCKMKLIDGNSGFTWKLLLDTLATILEK